MGPRPPVTPFGRFWLGQTMPQFGSRIGAFGMPVVAVQSPHAGNRDVGFLAAAATVAFLLTVLPVLGIGRLIDHPGPG
ncbi:hypothetical protein [Dactylosporangium sp. NPDC005555]|uniref:hypothetical protein n=1 Tax=Dactylosporangium sp. NPDC005555 TaxID=3154889 RepID=UPI0033B10B61